MAQIIRIELVTREFEEVEFRHIYGGFRNEKGKYYLRWFSETKQGEKIREVTKTSYETVLDALKINE